jgi:hypothetical protein
VSVVLNATSTGVLVKQCLTKVSITKSSWHQEENGEIQAHQVKGVKE